MRRRWKNSHHTILESGLLEREVLEVPRVRKGVLGMCAEVCAGYVAGVSRDVRETAAVNGVLRIKDTHLHCAARHAPFNRVLADWIRRTPTIQDTGISA